MPSIESLGPALRLLRERVAVTQSQLERDAGLGASSISRYERGVERPTLTTLDAILRAIGVGLYDLVLALDEAEGRVSSGRRGRPNARWVAALSGRSLDEDRLFGFAAGVLEPGDAQAREDFVASVETVASELARRVVAELDRPQLQVAEPAASYGRRPGEKKKT